MNVCWLYKTRMKKGEKRTQRQTQTNKLFILLQWFYNWVIVISNTYYSFETRAVSFCRFLVMWQSTFRINKQSFIRVFRANTLLRRTHFPCRGIIWGGPTIRFISNTMILFTCTPSDPISKCNISTVAVHCLLNWPFHAVITSRSNLYILEIQVTCLSG